MSTYSCFFASLNPHKSPHKTITTDFPKPTSRHSGSPLVTLTSSLPMSGMIVHHSHVYQPASESFPLAIHSIQSNAGDNVTLWQWKFMCWGQQVASCWIQQIKTEGKVRRIFPTCLTLFFFNHPPQLDVKLNCPCAITRVVLVLLGKPKTSGVVLELWQLSYSLKRN